jgi:uncharacterized protein YhbP (UPF0306 family)
MGTRRSASSVNEGLNARVREALGRTEIMALSTLGPDGPWTSPVQFRFNDKLELFFLSMLQAKHVQNIMQDARVSVAIYSHPGPPGGNLGLQIKGRAEHQREESAPDGWQSFRIIPEDVWCFDSRVFGHERRRVDTSGLRL